MRGNAAVAVYSDEQVPSAAGVEDVSPPRESRSTDATKLSFPLQLMLGAIFTTASIIGGIWGVTSGLRSDIRDIRTRMELQAEVDKARNEARTAEAKAFNDRAEMISESMADLRRLTQLLQIQYQEMNKERR